MIEKTFSTICGTNGKYVAHHCRSFSIVNIEIESMDA